MIQEWLLDHLCCTKCRGELEEKSETLQCLSCGAKYPIKNGIPIMIDLENLPEHLRGQVQYFEEVRGTKLKGHELAPWQKSYLRRIFESLNIKPGAIVVDSGTGSGYAAIEIARKGVKVIALDLTLKSQLRLKAIAKEEGVESNIGLACCTAENLPLKDATADHLISFAVLEHLPKEKEAIQEIGRVCKKKASIMVSVPIKYQYMHPLFYIPHIIFDRQIGHLRRYDEKDLKKKFSGWNMTKVYYTGHAYKSFKVAINFIRPIFDNDKIEEQDRKLENKKLWSTVVTGVFER